jgi:signal transduction histidine kinase
MAYARLQKTNWELEEALQTAEDANKAKANFLAMMSHELRTPITGMMGFSEILVNDETLAANQKEYAHIIFGCGNRLLKVVNDLLEMSTMEAGKYEIKYQELSLSEILEDIHILYANNFEKKEIRFTVKLNGIDKIVSDEIKLRHILLNLIGNAVKFTERGKVSICAKEENGYYIFAIKDTGIGIPEHMRTTIFDMFMQAENVECRKYEGIGLGLTICKRLVEALGGVIWIDGELESGSTFLFKIPVVEKKNYQLI